MLGKIEAVQTVTYAKLTLRVVEYQNFISTFYSVFHQSPLLRTLGFFQPLP